MHPTRTGCWQPSARPLTSCFMNVRQGQEALSPGKQLHRICPGHSIQRHRSHPHAGKAASGRRIPPLPGAPTWQGIGCCWGFSRSRPRNFRPQHVCGYPDRTKAAVSGGVIYAIPADHGQHRRSGACRPGTADVAGRKPALRSLLVSSRCSLPAPRSTGLPAVTRRSGSPVQR